MLYAVATMMFLQFLPVPFLMGNPSSDVDAAILTPSAPILTRPTSGGIQELHAGQQAIIETTIKNNDNVYDWASYVIIEVRDSNGVTILLNWQSGVVGAGSQKSVGVSWTPEYAGDYEIRTFVISSLDSPRILSLVSSSQVKIGAAANNECDESLWEHVYNPERLKRVDECISVTGIIEAVRSEEDGDYHILVKLDDQYSDLVNEENIQNQKGDLVVETVCQRPVTQEDAVSACLNFNANQIDIPPVGSHVKVTGSYVLDLQHGGWAEIHPATSIIVIEEKQESSGGSPNENLPPSTPTEQTGSLSVKVDFAHDPIVRGNTQTITVIVTDANTGERVGEAGVDGMVTYASGSTTKPFSGITEQDGEVAYTWKIGGNSSPGTFSVDIEVSADGYEDANMSTSFEVISAT